MYPTYLGKFNKLNEINNFSTSDYSRLNKSFPQDSHKHGSVHSFKNSPINSINFSNIDDKPEYIIIERKSFDNNCLYKRQSMFSQLQGVIDNFNNIHDLQLDISDVQHYYHPLAEQDFNELAKKELNELQNSLYHKVDFTNVKSHSDYVIIDKKLFNILTESFNSCKYHNPSMVMNEIKDDDNPTRSNLNKLLEAYNINSATLREGQRDVAKATSTIKDTIDQPNYDTSTYKLNNTLTKNYLDENRNNSPRDDGRNSYHRLSYDVDNYDSQENVDKKYLLDDSSQTANLSWDDMQIN